MKMPNYSNVPDNLCVLHEALHERNGSIRFLVSSISDVEIKGFHRSYNWFLDSLSILFHDKILSIRVDFLHVRVIFLFFMQHNCPIVVLVVIPIDSVFLFFLIIFIFLSMPEFASIIVLLIFQLMITSKIRLINGNKALFFQMNSSRSFFALTFSSISGPM